MSAGTDRMTSSLSRNHPFHCASINYDGIMNTVFLEMPGRKHPAINRFALTELQ